MKKLLLAGILLAIVVTAGTTAGFALAGGEASKPISSEPASPMDCSQAHDRGDCLDEQYLQYQSPVLPDAGLDPDVCNIAACDGGGTPQLHPVRSDEGIDPNGCNPVHNINVCTAEELEELGMVGPLGAAEKGTHGDPTYEEWLLNYAPPVSK